jgi:hypothetical protein
MEASCSSPTYETYEIQGTVCFHVYKSAATIPTAAAATVAP